MRYSSRRAPPASRQVALIYVAAAKFAPGAEGEKHGFAQLSLRVQKLLEDHLLHQFVGPLTTRLRAVAEQYEPAVIEFASKARAPARSNPAQPGSTRAARPSLAQPGPTRPSPAQPA